MLCEVLPGVKPEPVEQLVGNAHADSSGYAHARRSCETACPDRLTRTARRADLSSSREALVDTVGIAAPAALGAASRAHWRPPVRLGRASGPEGGADALGDADGEPRVRLGRDLRGARAVAPGGDPVRLPGRVRGQHLLVRAHAPLPAVPPEPALDEPPAAVRAAVEPRRLRDVVGRRALGVHLAARSAAVRRRAAGGAVVRRRSWRWSPFRSRSTRPWPRAPRTIPERRRARVLRRSTSWASPPPRTCSSSTSCARVSASRRSRSACC